MGIIQLGVADQLIDCYFYHSGEEMRRCAVAAAGIVVASMGADLAASKTDPTVDENSGKGKGGKGKGD